MPIYDQRWLREHNAVPTDRGWTRPTTGELLKCQKYLEHSVPDQPILKSVTMYDVPQYVLVDPLSFKSDVKIKYRIDEPDYKPINVDPRMSLGGGLIMTPKVDEELKEITYQFSNVRVDGSSARLELIVDGKRTTRYYETVYFSINYENPKVTAIYLSDLLKTIFFYNDTGKGRSSNYYRVFDTVFHYEHDDVETIIEYNGNGNVYTTRPSSNSPNNINNSIYLHIEGDMKDGEEIKLQIKIGDVISNQTVYKVAVRNKSNNEIQDTPEDWFDNLLT